MITNLKQKLKAMSSTCPLPESKPAKGGLGLLRGEFGGEIIHDIYGCHVVKRSIYPLEGKYGLVSLENLSNIKSEPCSLWTKVEVPFSAKDLVFLDTETTGLAGGTGTVVFLVGLGYISGDYFIVEQHLMRDFDEELSMLNGIMEVLRRYNILVTFNGKSFDWPLLESRLIASRVKPMHWEGTHIDLLHAARRLWSRKIDSCSLISLECNILAHFREGDIPGFEIPAIYLNYLNTRQQDAMGKVINHNEWDIAAMAALLVYINSLYIDDFKASDSYELFGIAKDLEKAKQYSKAIDCYMVSIQISTDKRLILETKKRLAYLLKRERRLEQAAIIWLELADRDGNLMIFPHIEMAKYFEHKIRDYHSALLYTENALSLAVAHRGGHDNICLEIKKRRQRLVKKLERIDKVWG